MRVAKVEVRNFRCLRDVEVPMSSPTALVGADGSGKSTLIRALEFFFGRRSLDARDCWGGDEGLEVRVALVFADLEPGGREELEPWLEDDGTLRIEKACSPGDGSEPASRFVTRRRRHPPFADVRAESSKSGILSAYRALRQRGEYEALPNVPSPDDALAALVEWERAHPDRLEREEDDAVGSGEVDLDALAELIVVPAVRDAGVDATDTVCDPFDRLAELLVRYRPPLEDELLGLERDLAERYGGIVRQRGDSPLGDAQPILSERLAGPEPGAAAGLGWAESAPGVSPPCIRSELMEGGFPTEVGHAVQGAYVVAVLQALAELRYASADSADERPLTLLAIEEPELYRLADCARFLAPVLGRSSRHGEATQVVYATHSPVYVPRDAVESLRLFCREAPEGEPPQAGVANVDLDAAAEELWRADGAKGEPFTVETLRPRLRAMTESPVAEGFFSPAVVLVEGEEHRAYVVAAIRAAGVDPEELGIAVLPGGGKSALDCPLVVFRQLGIPTYVVWDGDAHHREKPEKARPADNRRLLALLGADPDDHPQTRVHATWACFEETLATTVRAELGKEHFAAAVDDVATRLDIHEDREESASVLAEALTQLHEAGHESPTLRRMVDRVLERAGAGGRRRKG